MTRVRTTKQKAICILGMHRSGTSAIARAINLLGAYIGREDHLMPARKDNPDGFWEHMAIYSFHERLLKFLSRSWDSLFPMPDEWWKKPEIEPYRKELIDLIRREFGGRPLWMWKDPRTSLLLPLWKEVLQELETDICYVICLRNPLDVAASLRRRDNFSKSKSFALWLLYTASACYWTNGKKRMVVHFDHLLADCEESLRKVSIAFDLPWPQDDQPLRKAMADFIRLSSHHSYSSLDSLLNDKDGPEDVLPLYRLLLDCEKDQGFFESTEFEEYILKLFARYKERTYPSPLQSAQSLSEKTSPFEQQKLDELDILHFDRPSNFQVSIIIPAWNQWQYTFCCLRSILENTEDVAYEVIVVDDGSSDETSEMLKKVENIEVMRHKSNLGYILVCNDGAKNAQGNYLLFLNNDTIVTKGWLKSMVEVISSNPTAGAVGAKLIYPDGRLQEAGGMIFSDGRSWNFGKGDDPETEIYNQPCEVDYCSGACFLVRKSLFNGLGGFDERYSPGYYEEADLCFAMRRIGYKVLYNPEAVVIHHGSVTTRENAYSWAEISRKKFIEKWENELTYQDEHPSITGEFPATANRERLTKIATFETKTKILKNVYKLLDSLTEDRDAWKKAYSASEADRAARLEVINKLSVQLQENEVDRAARLDQVNELTRLLKDSEADRAARLEVINKLSVQLQESEVDRAARLEVINRQNDLIQKQAEEIESFKRTFLWKVTALFRNKNIKQ